MILFNAYKYLYYRIYSWQLRWFGEDEIPEIKAAVLITLLFSLNIYAILLAITAWTRFNIIETLNFDKIKMGLGYLFIFGFNYFIFVNKKHYKQIAEQFKNESVFRRRTNLILIFAYVIFSLVIPILI